MILKNVTFAETLAFSTWKIKAWKTEQASCKHQNNKSNNGLRRPWRVALHYITFYLADAFIQSDEQSSAIQGHTTTEHARYGTVHID